jgi:hypothetical protein
MAAKVSTSLLIALGAQLCQLLSVICIELCGAEQSTNSLLLGGSNTIFNLITLGFVWAPWRLTYVYFTGMLSFTFVADRVGLCKCDT